MSAAMHDDPRIFPLLPPRAADKIDSDWLGRLAEREDDPFRTAWEFMLTHNLTDSEGAAFWNGASLVYEAMKAGVA